MIFPKIECDLVVQVNDKFRINASKSYVPKGGLAIVKVEIEPEAGAGYIDVTGASPINSKNWFLDWEYATDGSKVVSLKVTTNLVGPVEQIVTLTVNCLLASEDKLLSDDSDLVAIESDILKYVPEGKSSFNYVHREAQGEILEWLFTNGYTKYDSNPLTIDNIVNVSEFNFWSKYSVLRLLYEDFSKAPNDVFDVKAKHYENISHKWRHKAILHLDYDGDGVQGSSEGSDMTTRRFIRV